MDDDGGSETHDDGAGTAAVLYGMFTSFTEALDRLEERLAAIEATVRAGPGDLTAHLARVEAATSRLAERTAAAPAGEPLGDLIKAQSEGVDRRLVELEASVDALRILLQGHIDDTAQSLGRRASEAGRRLVSDLGLRSRPKPPPTA